MRRMPFSDKSLECQAYITGSAFAVLDGSQTILQTIYDDDDQPLDAIAIDEHTGKIATCTPAQVRVYRPLGLREDSLKVGALGFASPWHGCIKLTHVFVVGTGVVL